MDFMQNKLFNAGRLHDYNVHYLLPVTSGGDSYGWDISDIKCHLQHIRCHLQTKKDATFRPSKMPPSETHPDY